MNEFSGTSEDKNAKRNVDSQGQLQEVSGDKTMPIGNWTNSHLCYILQRICLYFAHVSKI